MDQVSKEAIRKRLARMEGQVRRLMTMVEEEREPADILTQVAAARAALTGVGSMVLRWHVEDTVSSIGPDGESAEIQARIDRIRIALERFVD